MSSPADIYQKFLKEFNRNPPVDTGILNQFDSHSGIRLPNEYTDFLKQMNGGEGFLGNSYVILWSLEELSALNEAYQVCEYASGLVLFGSDGSGEAFGFDNISDVEMSKPVVSIPFVGMARELVRPVAPNFQGFLEVLSNRSLIPMTSEGLKQDNIRGKEVFEVHPVILGGSPTDPANKALLTREEHIEVVRFWNNTIRESRNQ